MLAEGSSISFVSLLITRYRQKNKYQLKQLLCTSTKHAASVPAESFSKTSTAESRPTSPATVQQFFAMIDKRNVLKQHDDRDPSLESLSDTEILLEFSKVLALVYPSLIKLRSHCYDNFDHVSENLFYDLVYYTFSSKYGTIIDKNETHRYGFSLHTYRHIHHICIKP